MMQVKMVWKRWIGVGLSLCIGLCGWAQTRALPVGDTHQAMRTLTEIRAGHLLSWEVSDPAWMEGLIDLGLWQIADQFLSSESLAPGFRLAKARLAYLRHRYQEAETQLSSIEAEVAYTHAVRLMRIRLHIAAWELGLAEDACGALLKENARDEEAVLLLGRIHLLRKNYPKAKALAEQVIQWNPGEAEAWLLAAEVAFWQREQTRAETLLRACLERNPYHPDARFYYGYALWRRVDATLLPQMAAHWELALMVHPLHYLTHWHWGNGHTHLTFVDYVASDDESVRIALKKQLPSLKEASEKQVLEGIARVRDKYPTSILPDLMRASYLYLAHDPLGKSRLDEAEQAFVEMLDKKAHYGPAHNGLAAVIKKRQMEYLASFDSLENLIQGTQILDSASFFAVFPDISQYPGERVGKMVWGQLHSAVAYFPFLARLNHKFVIPPLHQDLADAMNNLYFRQATTFDNRQWMDIRGVGSGATGIEYVERGSHLERNVTLHEYVHLFHGQIFSDQEMREIRKRYYHAMENGLTLDYYAANNEFEYFAQAFPAYFARAKVHPLNHKSVNTREDLAEKDPLMYAFVDSLVKKHGAYLQGKKAVMKANWAEVYRKLADRADLNGQYVRAQTLLDSAWAWDSTYVPLYLLQARIWGGQQKLEEARDLLDLTLLRFPDYAPTYQALANWAAQAQKEEQLSPEETFKVRRGALQKAFALEQDPDIRARMNEALRTFFLAESDIQEAIAAAEAYVNTAPTISTYLRDRIDEAAAFAMEQKGLLGYEEALVFFQDLIERKPQAYQHRAQYARVLISQQQYQQALDMLTESQQILEASRSGRADFYILQAAAALALGDSVQVTSWLEPYQGRRRLKREVYRGIRLLADVGWQEAATRQFKKLGLPDSPHRKAEYRYTEGYLAWKQGEPAQAIQHFQEALVLNLYHMPARFALLDLLQDQGEGSRVKKYIQQGMVLPIPPGPRHMQRLQAFGEED
ncbi:MAG: tetratricopeptide repeat protein [Bacteroidota bacterium]